MTLPSRSNDYQAPSAPVTFLTRELWNAVLGDIAARLNDREMLEASFELLQTQGIQASLDYVQATIAPVLENLQAEIALAQAQIATIINDGIAPDSQKLGGQLPAHYASAQALADGLALLVPTTRTVNGKSLSADVVLEKADVGLGNADNTADADKPVSAATETALALRLRVDGAQGLSPAQKAWARANAEVGIVAGLRDKLINGDFGIIQRGATQTANGYRSVDRWAFINGTGAAGAITRVLASSISAFPFGTRDTLLWTRTTVGSTPSFIYQPIESVLAFGTAATQVTVQVLAWANAPCDLEVFINQVFGLGGSETVVSPTQSIALTTTPTIYKLVFDMPATSGKIYGAGDNITVVLQRPITGSNPTTPITLDRVAAVQGDARNEADIFSPRHIQQEEALCQRYYSKSYRQYDAPGTNTPQGALNFEVANGIAKPHAFSWSFPVAMRIATPTITMYSVNGTSGRVTNSFGNPLSILYFTSEKNAMGGTSEGLDHQFLRWHWTAEAEL